jgi:hypothetical protein
LWFAGFIHHQQQGEQSMKIIGKTAAVVTKSITHAPKRTKSLAGSFTNKVKEGWNEGMHKDKSDEVIVFELTDDVIEAQV